MTGTNLVALFGRNLRWLYTAGAALTVLSLSVQTNGETASAVAWCVGLSLASVIVVWRFGFGRCLSIAALIATGGIAGFLPPHDPALTAALPLWCGLLVLGLRGTTRVVGLVAINVLYVSIGTARLPDADPTTVIVESFGRTATAVAVVLVASSGMRAAAAWEEQAAISRAKVRAESEVLATEAQARWVDHFLHDRVVHALKAVTLSDQLTRREIVAAARETVADLDALATPKVPSALGARLRAATDGIDVRIRWRVDDVWLPGDVCLAFVEAAREALRNVRQHSGVDRADVELRQTGQGVCLTVRDRGRGFDPKHTPHGHFGLRDGVRARMAAVGGEAAVHSSPRGTTVSLTWGDSNTGRDWTDVLGFRSLMIMAGSPFVVLNVVQAIAVADRLRHPGAALLATFIVTLTWTVGAAMLRRRPGTPRESLGLVGIALGATAVGSVSVSVDFDPITYWLAGGTLPLMLLAIASRPIKRTLAWALLWACLPMGCLLLLGIDAAQLQSFAPALASCVVALLFAYAAVFVIRRVVADAARRAQADDLSVERSIRAGARQRLLDARMSELRERIEPFLADIAQTRVDPAEPQVRRLARSFEARVRDVLGGAQTRWPDELQHTVDALRTRGANVTLAKHASPTPAQLASVGAVLRCLETTEVSQTCVSVSVTPRRQGSLTAVTVTPYVPLLFARLASARSPVQVRTDHSSYLSISHPLGPPGPENAGHASTSVLIDSEDAALHVERDGR